MKRVSLLLAILIILTGTEVFAIPYDFYGGVADEIEYSEYVFLSGKPVKMVGTYTAEQTIEKTTPSTTGKINFSGSSPKMANNNTVTTKVETYSFNLLSEDGKSSLTRQMNFETKLVEQKGVKQATGNTVLTSWNENVNIDGVSYVLQHYFFSKANTNDMVPISDFYKGAIKSRRIYSINGGQGTATINTTGNTTGYYNLWGNAETVKLENSIVVNINNPQNQGGNQGGGNNLTSFRGSYTVNVTDANTVSLQYDENEGEASSIRGSDVMVERYEAISNYTYILPQGKGAVSLHTEKMPFLKPLIATKFRDVNGIPEQDAIEKLSSMIKQIDNGVGVFMPKDDTVDNLESDGTNPANETVTEYYSDIFHPQGRLTRIDFIRAFLNLTNMRYEIQTEPSPLTIIKDRYENYEHGNEKSHVQKGIYALNYENYFLDIKDYHPDFELIENGVKNGVIKGRKRSRFRPDEDITKEEMATFFVRALGMENRAPNPAYYTEYSDDSEIANWARDSIYMATELGIFIPDEDGNFNPQSTVTRAEGAEILMRYVQFLEKDLKKKYEDIIKY